VTQLGSLLSAQLSAQEEVRNKQAAVAAAEEASLRAAKEKERDDTMAAQFQATTDPPFSPDVILSLLSSLSISFY